MEQYVPHPLDLSTLFDFLKLFEEEDDQYGTRKMSSLLGNPDNSNGGMCCQLRSQSALQLQFDSKDSRIASAAAASLSRTFE